MRSQATWTLGLVWPYRTRYLKLLGCSTLLPKLLFPLQKVTHSSLPVDDRKKSLHVSFLEQLMINFSVTSYVDAATWAVRSRLPLIHLPKLYSVFFLRPFFFLKKTTHPSIFVPHLASLVATNKGNNDYIYLHLKKLWGLDSTEESNGTLHPKVTSWCLSCTDCDWKSLLSDRCGISHAKWVSTVTPPKWYHSGIKERLVQCWAAYEKRLGYRTWLWCGSAYMHQKFLQEKTPVSVYMELIRWPEAMADNEELQKTYLETKVS